MRGTGALDELSSDDWFNLLVRSHLDALFLHVRLAYPLANTESIVVEVFARAHAAAVAPTIGPRAWLRRMAREAVLGDDDTIAARRNAEAAAFGLHDAIDLVDGQRDALEHLIGGLTELPIADQELLRLSSIEDLDLDELAWILETDVTGAALKLEAARRRLREACAAISDDEGVGGEP